MLETGKDEATREAIIQAARGVFQKWGLGKTTMEDIARKAGKGKSTLYYYYQSKEEIFDTVVRAETGALLSRAKETVREVNSARERLRRYIVASITEMKNSAVLYEIVRREIGENPHFLRKIREQSDPGEVQFLQDILALGVQQNHFSFANDQELETAAEVVLELVRAIEVYLFLENSDIRHIDMAAKLIVNGL